MINKRRTHLHPLEEASMLDSTFRHLFQSPKKIISKFIDPGMAVLDLGCGTERIELYHCKEQYLGLEQKFDFILAFYSFHEMEYLDNIIKELQEICNPKTKILIAEQKFHVSKFMFRSFIEKMEINNFKVIARPNIFLSRAVVMVHG